MRAYNALPREFMGFGRGAHSLYYADRGGVVTVRDFFETFTGLTALPETAGEWLRIPEYALFAAVNGEIYVTSGVKSLPRVWRSWHSRVNTTIPVC